MSKVGIVLSSSPRLISIEIIDLAIFERNKLSLQPGRYLKIEDGNHNFALSIITNIKATHESTIDSDMWRLVVECVPVGALLVDGASIEFRRGSPVLPVPTEAAHVVDSETLNKIFSANSESPFLIGSLASNPETPFYLHGDHFFGKHIAVVGSTGSGKSCAVAHILQKTVGIVGEKYSLKDKQNNAHIVIFDLHAEYAAAFKLADEHAFSLNELTVEELLLPYWLMNSEELESMFIESGESNSHNQISMFKRAVILNKRRHNNYLDDINYDTPCYFSMDEVVNFIENMNREVIGRLEGEGRPKLASGILVDDVTQYYFDDRLEFVANSSANLTKATNGPFNGEFTRFVSRLETTLSDERLRLFRPRKGNGDGVKTEDFSRILQQFIGYIDKSNVSVIDLSGIPFEVLSVTVSLIARMIFDFCFHYSKIRHEEGLLNDVPILIVCEEAHNYVPASDAVMYRSSRKSIERIAKEGRKYGLGLMVVSQRPSEVSPTIFAQCNNFVAMRLTNFSDQAYIKSLLPEDGNGAADQLSSLPQGDALVVGDAVVVPAVIRMPLPAPQPKSASVGFLSEWQEAWRSPVFDDVIGRWRKIKKVK